MVKFASTIVATALLSVPALAMSVKQYERNLAESDLYGRDFFSDEETFAAREDLDAELEAREPVNPATVAHVFHLLHKAHKHAHHASGLLPNGNQENDRREFEEEDIYGREFDVDEDLEAREPVNPATVAHVFHLLHKAHKHTHHASGLLPNGNQENDRREFEDEDIYGRELNFDEDLEAREPVNPATVAHVFHLLHKAHKHAHHASGLLPNGNQENDRRELEDEDIFERELDDDLFERDFDELLTREYYDDLD